jgi:hypothetical protein
MAQLAILCFRTYLKEIGEEDLGNGKKFREPVWTPHRDERMLFGSREEAEEVIAEFAMTNKTMRLAFIVEVNEEDEEALDAVE